MRWPGFKARKSLESQILASDRVAYRLARQLGTTVARMDRTVAAAEYINWAALFAVEDEQDAAIAHAIAGS